MTTDAAGTNTSNGNGPTNSFTYDPFGNVLSGSALPNNADQASLGWVGQHEKFTESTFATTPIQMGARVYIPGLGRFLQVDPVEGGTPNSYVCPGDPVNEWDLTGEAGRSVNGGKGNTMSDQQWNLIKKYGIKGRGPVNRAENKAWKAGLQNLKSQEKYNKARASRATKDIPRNVRKTLEKGDIEMVLISVFLPWSVLNNIPGSSNHGPVY